MPLQSTQVIEFAENSTVNVVTSSDDPTKLAVTTFDVTELGDLSGAKRIPRGQWNAATDDYALQNSVTHNFVLYVLTSVGESGFADVGSAPSDNLTQWTLEAELGSQSGFEREDW